MKFLASTIVVFLATLAHAQSFNPGLNPPSVGKTNVTAPISATLGGYVDSNGKLQPFTGSPGGGGISVSVGSVNAVQSGPWDIRNITGTVSLPNNAAQDTTLGIVGTTLTAMSAKLPATLGQKTSANSLAVVVASDQSNIGVTQGTSPWVTSRNWTLSSATDSATVTGTVTSSRPTVSTASVPTRIANSASNQTLLASNASRVGAIFYNDNTSANACYIKFGASSSLTSFTIKLFATDTYIMDSPVYTGAISFICDAASGSMEATEL